MQMLSPNPLALLCALLLCLPLALIFTTTGTNYSIPSSTVSTVANPRLIFLSLHSSSRRRPPQLPLPATAQNPPPPPPPPPPTTAKIKSLKQEAPKRHHRSSNDTTNTHHRPPPPLSLLDDKEDESLFKRASRVKPNPKPTRPKKIAFMFLTTTAPLPLAPLWEIFFKYQSRSHYNIYIHTNPSLKFSNKFTGIFTNRSIPSSKPTSRHTPTLISAARRLLSHALLHDPSNAMFALLSDSCIPLHSFTFTYKTLITANYRKKSFIEILKNETGSYGRWAARGELAMLPQVKLDAFRIGSQFWVLTRKHARMVVKDDKKLWDKFKLPCVDVMACYPEENYFPTMLSMLDPKGVVPATLTHVDWNGRFDGHPRMYNESEIGKELIQRLRGERPRYGDYGVGEEEVEGKPMWIRKNGYDHERREDEKGGGHPFLFARKFGKNCVQRLLSMASIVIFKD